MLSHFESKTIAEGIPLSEAIDYAFHFGRRADTPIGQDHSIGLYGIGLKRAIFKIGNQISINTCHDDDSYVVNIDVEKWAKQSDWDFDFAPADKLAEHGTRIEIQDLNGGIGEEFSDRLFVNEVTKAISRDYSIFLQKGFAITVNENEIPPYVFSLKESADIKPIREEYTDETGVTVNITAGMGGSPPDDTSTADVRFPQTEYWGWYVVCNDRVVIAGNKDDTTVWGDGEFPNWHPQYNGFIGIVSFQSQDPNLLPWTTTKREIDPTTELYRRALVQMKRATRPYLDYTNDRKDNLDLARSFESKADLKPVSALPLQTKMYVPKVASSESKVKTTTISYCKPMSEVKEVAALLGNRHGSNRFVGEKTFDYYRQQEIQDD